jgi:hypothetical protein
MRSNAMAAKPNRYDTERSSTGGGRVGLIAADSSCQTWDQSPKGGWDAFQTARRTFLLAVAIDTALFGIDLKGDAESIEHRRDD